MTRYNDINAKFFVRDAARKAADILRDYQDGVKKTNADPMIPDGGKLYKAGELKSEAIQKLEGLKEQTDLAAILYRKESAHYRDEARPVVKPADRDAYVRRFTHLLDRGVGLEAVIDRFSGDQQAVRVLQDEYQTFAWGAYPDDPGAADAFGAQIDRAAYDSFDPDYRKKTDALKDFDRGAYRVDVAINQALHAARDGDLEAGGLPDFDEGRLAD